MILTGLFVATRFSNDVIIIIQILSLKNNVIQRLPRRIFLFYDFEEVLYINLM